MASLFFIKPCLSALEEGRTVRFGLFIMMWIMAIALVVAGLVQWVNFWNNVSGQMAAGVIGVIIYQIAFLLLLYFLFQILVIRAGDVLNIEPYDNRYSVIPIMSVLIRAAGEFLATLWIFYGLGGMIIYWFSGYAPYTSTFGLFSLYFGTGFKGGILSLLAGIVHAFATIVAAYFLAEAIMLCLGHCADVKKIRQVSEGYEKPPAAGKI